MKSIIIFCILLTTLNTLQAQFSISGKITDEQQQPLSFANIVLHHSDNTQSPKGVISNEEGIFVFENIDKGNYYIEISMLSFVTHKTEKFLLVKNKTFNFTLKEESQTLNEVVVTSKRPIIKQTAEKLIVDLEKTEMLNTNLQDIMRKVPGVLVTNNGISIAGKSGIRILINGKTTEYMDIDTLLRDFPADNIAKIEVVEQPGAEYDASGTGAIINIILKKNVRLGTHGNIMGWVGEDEGFEYGTSASLASYKNKLNWQTSIAYSEPTWRDDLFLTRTVQDTIYDQVTKSPFAPKNLSFNGSLDYYINEKHSIGIGSRWNKRKSIRTSSSKTNIIKPTITEILFSKNSFNRDRIDYNINPYYEYKTDTDRLLIDLNFISYKNNNTNTLFDTEESTLPFIDKQYKQDGNFTIKTYQADYNKNFTDNLKLSMGSKYTIVNTNNDLQSYFENNTGGFDFDPTTSSQFLVNETIFAIYSKINVTYEKWSFSGGLRYEGSDTNGTSIYLKNGIPVNDVKKRPIRKLFPSASISRKLTEKLGANLSYSYRVRRPSYNSLNSFQEFLDPFSAQEGNPSLKPAFTNNYQFNLTFDNQPFFTIGYSKTSDEIFDLIKQNNATAQIRQQVVNVEDFTNWNFRLFGPLNFIKGVEGYTGIIVNNSSYNSTIHNVDISKWNLYWFMQASYKLPWDINLELNGNYGTGALEGQINVDWLAALDFSLSKKFLDEKLKVNLGFNKMLNRGFVGTIDYGNGTANVESNSSRQNIQLRLSYSFGSKFGKKKTTRNTAKEEENRINDNN